MILSDSDDDFARRKPARAGDTVDLELSDSDSDDSLPAVSTRTNISRAVARKKERLKLKNDQFLESAIKSCTEQTGRHLTVVKLEKEQESCDFLSTAELSHSNSNLKESRDALKKEEECALEESSSVNGSGADDWGTRPCIHLANANVVTSLGHALECLSDILSQHNERFPAEIYNLLVAHLRANTMHLAFQRVQFHRLFKGNQLPAVFFHWLIATACALPSPKTNGDSGKLECLSLGSSKLFLRLTKQKQCESILHLEDFEAQLRFFFGLNQIPKENREPVVSSPKNASNSIQPVLQTFLYLWSQAFRYNLVSQRNNAGAVSTCSSAILTLLDVALDPLIENTTR